MLYFKKLKNSKGQALVEAALIAPLIVFFLFSVIWFARVLLTWQQITAAARYGTDLIAYSPFSRTYIENDIINYLCSPSNVGRILDRDKLKVTVVSADMDPHDYTISVGNIESFNPLGIAAGVRGILPVLLPKSYVEISYEYKLPMLISIIGAENNKIKVRARSEVLTGFGGAGQKKRE